MSEAIATPAADPANPNPPVKFAGKYDSPEAFDKGFREGAKKAGFAFSDKTKLYGEGGMFADIKAAEEGYANIERAITSKGNAKGEKPAGEKSSVPMPDDKVVELSEEDGISELVTKAGLTESALGLQYMENGKLTDEQYAALKKVMPGATKKTIDQMVSSQVEVGKAKWDSVTAKAETIAGGKQQLTDLVKWAGQNLDKSTVAALVSQAKNNPDFYPDMIEHFAMKYAGANGGKPGGSGVGPGVGKASNSSVVRTTADFKALRQAVERGEPGAKERLAAADMSNFKPF